MDTVHIHGNCATAESPEGHKASIDLAVLMRKMAPSGPDTGKAVLADGVKAIRTRGRRTIWVHETAPQVYNFKWIAADSRVSFGRGTKYRAVSISLPYVITFCVFDADERGQPQLSGANECFFRTAPLNQLDADTLCYPALLNCSKFPVEQGHPLSWVCSQHIDFLNLTQIEDPGLRTRAGFRTLMECLFGSGFNLSSEEHEGASWFTETISRKVDPRISSVERWEQETVKDRMFVLEIPWIETNLTVEQMLDRIFSLGRARGSNGVEAASSDDIARLIFNSK